MLEFEWEVVTISTAAITTPAVAAAPSPAAANPTASSQFNLNKYGKTY
jgi:hypothetical protein